MQEIFVFQHGSGIGGVLYEYQKAEDSKKSYPPYKYEIEMLKQEQFDPQMKEKILEDNQKWK